MAMAASGRMALRVDRSETASSLAGADPASGEPAVRGVPLGAGRRVPAMRWAPTATATIQTAAMASAPSMRSAVLRVAFGSGRLGVSSPVSSISGRATSCSPR